MEKQSLFKGLSQSGSTPLGQKRSCRHLLKLYYEEKGRNSKRIKLRLFLYLHLSRTYLYTSKYLLVKKLIYTIF